MRRNRALGSIRFDLSNAVPWRYEPALAINEDFLIAASPHENRISDPTRRAVTLTGPTTT
jgi:hypothetical protein